MKNLVRRISGGAGAGAVGLFSLLGLAGCFDNDPGMQEKLVRTQVELQETKQKLQDAQAALQKAQGSLQVQAAATPAPTPAAPTKEQLNDGYISAAKEMRSQLETELTGYSILNCTLYQVSTVAALPYTSKVAIALRSDKGQQYKLELPVGADTSGKWKFPTTQEILDGIAKNPPKTAASNAPQTGPRAFEPRAPDKAATPPAVSGMGDANVETVPLTWSQSQTRSSGQSRSQGSTPVQPPAPASMPGAGMAGQRALPPAPRPAAPPAAAPPSQPAPAMPADQSVLITF